MRRLWHAAARRHHPERAAPLCLFVYHPLVIIDSHAHFDPRILDTASILAKMDAAGVDRIAMIPAMNDLLPETPEALLAVMRRLSGS